MTQNKDQLQELGAGDAVYKQAFPTARVFIYGYEVTRDLISVNVNQSGGSIERSPSTCAITLSNMQDKYIINHQDMILIGKNTVDKNYEKDVKDSSAGASSFSGTDKNFRVDKNGHLMYSGEVGLVYPLGGSGTVIKWTSDEAKELVPRLALATDEELLYLLGAYGFNDITIEDARSIAAKLKFQRDLIAGNSYAKDPVLGSWDEGDIPFNLKGQIVSKKLRFTSPIVPGEEDASFLKYEDKIAYDYPFQEGDCIFHANDPVRVAFRDPYDPRRWYWMFTGFVDVWTENVGSNFDSQMSLTCTDVTKSLRYSTVQLSNSGRDVNIEDELNQITEKGGATLETSGLILNKNIFRGLRMQEIMELIFFGSQSVAARRKALDNEIFDQYADLFTNSLLTNDEFGELLINRYGYTANEALEIIPQGLDRKTVLQDAKLRNAVVDYLRAKSEDTLSSLAWQGITTPRGITFKRQSEAGGVHFYTYGPSSTLDKAFGADSVADFYEWNEIVHHRVKKSDLDNMRNDLSSPSSFDANISVDQVISQIGTNINDYPVGHGRVFYFAPAGLTELTDIGIMDRGIDAGVSAAAHSSFNDKLTLLYDVVQLVDWRFYATPKGDIVFEVPFYDHEPSDFYKPSNQNADLSDTNKDTLQRYEDIFQRQYSGDYDIEEAEELTDLAFSLNTSNAEIVDFNKAFDDNDYDYKKEFVVSIEEQSGFSNTFSDRGVSNVYGVLVNYVENNDQAQDDAIRKFTFVYDKSLIPILGKRFNMGNVKSFLGSEDGAKLFAVLELNRLNAEARSISIDTVPKFGLMVNRPILWKYRNYYCTIVSLSHSVAYNNDATTAIDANQIKAWSGVYDRDGRPVHKHFYSRTRPFDFADLLNRSRAGSKKDTK
ncbi:hypothetical protein N8Z24_00485 [bacterium]|nr:hypothetical protein [bacterium]